MSRRRRRSYSATRDCVWSVGVKPVFKVQPRERPHDARDGQAPPVRRRRAGSRSGARAGRSACARAPHSRSARAEHWPDVELVLLGHLVGDGSYLTHQPLRYTTASEENSEPCARRREPLAAEVNRHAGSRALASAGDLRQRQSLAPQGVGNWLQGPRHPRSALRTRSACRRGLPARQRAGRAAPAPPVGDRRLHHVRKAGGGGAPRVYFATVQPRPRLRRGGAAAAPRHRRAHPHGRSRPATGRCSRSTSPGASSSALSSTMSAHSVRGWHRRARCASMLEGCMPNTNVDTLPIEAFADVRAIDARAGRLHARDGGTAGTSYGGTSHFRFAPSRATIDDYAENAR